jgi:galactokinase
MANRPGDTATDNLIARAQKAGRNTFGPEFRPNLLSVAPGRLELLGNHVDYNGGPVLAAAIDRVVLVLLDDGGEAGDVAAVATDVAARPIRFSLGDMGDWESPGGEPDPEAYLRGAVAALLARNHPVRDRLRLSIAGDVTLGFGMSSSAALCVALVNALSVQPLSAREVVLTAQEAEHRAGTPCGTMDQSASVAGNVIRYDGSDDSFSVIEPDLGNYVFAVADSGVTRSLATSSYGDRVEEARRAVELLRQHLNQDISALGQLTGDQWQEIERHGEAWLPAPLLARVRHVFTECERVRAGIDAVERSDWKQFGQFMIESGRSSAGDYEISHPRVEELVGDVLGAEGVLGARMMGGGEGGPALILLERDALPALERTLRDGYFRRHGMAERDELIQACRFGPAASLVAFSV